MTLSLRRHRFVLSFFSLLCFAALALSASVSAAADSRAELDERVRRAGVAFHELRSVPDRRVPAELYARSRCVAVIPNVIKAAWIIGGRYGRGVLSCRSKTGEWSPPVIVTMSGGSFGFQFGMSSTDVVLFFMTTGSVRSLLTNKVKLSGDLGIAAGPVGRETEAATDARFTAEIYSYARSRGLFAGVSLSGSYLGVDRDATDQYYGTAYTPTSILFDQKVTSVPKSAWSFLGALPRPRPAVAAAAPAPAAPATHSSEKIVVEQRESPPEPEPSAEAPSPRKPVAAAPANRQLAPIVRAPQAATAPPAKNETAAAPKASMPPPVRGPVPPAHPAPVVAPSPASPQPAPPGQPALDTDFVGPPEPSFAPSPAPAPNAPSPSAPPAQ